MKPFILSLVIATLELGSLASAKAAVETYDIDPVHTWVGFSIAHFFTKVPGYFGKVKGTIVVDRDHLENSTVEAVIEVASITTNTKMRDDDLRSTNFFAAAQFPSMTFKSESWKSTGDNTYAVTGVLTMKNVAKEVVLKVTSLGFGPGMKGAVISGWEASLTLDRRDFDITADQGAIGNTVDGHVTIRAPAHTRRIALNYALLDGADVVDTPHLQAALAFWQYCHASAECIFGGASVLARDIHERLRLAFPGELDRTDLHQATGRNKSATEITLALAELHRYGLATPRKEQTGGAPRELWRAATK